MAKMGSVGDFINGIGALTEIWMITYRSFKNLNLSDAEALEHTKSFMAVAMHEIMTNGKESSDDQT